MAMKRVLLITLITLLVGSASCSKNPITGRKALNLLPEGELATMSLTNYKDFLKENKTITGTKQAKQVTETGSRIAMAVEKYFRQQKLADRLSAFNWEFNLIDDNTANAWCMPGGKVAVYTGILPTTKSETGLAVVMGHEVAHAVARHGNERMSQGLLQQLGGVGLGVAMQNKPQQTQAIFSTAYGLGSQVGLMLPFSRKHESEADEMGLIFMAMAGYDPKEAPAFWQRMGKNGGAQPPEFMSTHPSHTTRTANLQKFIPTAMTHYNPAARNAPVKNYPSTSLPKGGSGGSKTTPPRQGGGTKTSPPTTGSGRKVGGLPSKTGATSRTSGTNTRTKPSTGGKKKPPTRTKTTKDKDN
ncbi:MAG: M48 family metallopeptidase [Chitinophagales bacterium]